MKFFASLVFFAIVGIVSGAAAGAFSSGIIPACGEPCNVRRFGQVVVWALCLMLAFPIIGGLALRRIGNGLARTAAVAATLSFVALLPAAAIYGLELHRFYWKSPAALGVPDFDYSYMAIATRPVAAIYGSSRVRIKAWERCTLGPVYCDKRPRTVQAICLGIRKTVLIKEADWPAFQRIPEEDLPGLLNRPEDMRLCSEPSR
jgi:hypothetical protein